MKLHATAHGIAAPGHSESGDRFAVHPEEGGGMLGVLSDGVSAARDPARCAERVVRLVADSFSARPRQWTPGVAFERLVEQANRSLYEEGAWSDGTASMQATLSAVFLDGDRLHGLNVGDSPVLLVRNGETQRLSTTDATTNPDGMEILTQSVGMAPTVQPHYFEAPLRTGDLVMVVSDGITRVLDDNALGKTAERFGSAGGLVRHAAGLQTENTADDLSAIVFEVLETGRPLPSLPAQAMPMPHLAKGESFDGYHLLRPLGGNPRVWMAERDAIRFVLKFVPQEAEIDDSGALLARFSREAWNACRLHGEFFTPSRMPESGSPHYYVMDYVEAPSLSFFLKSRKLTADEAVSLGGFLCRAGQFLLRRELVHGDIKPDNILVSQEGGEMCFKLLDLGLASPIFTDAGRSGTPSYLAPERFRGAVITERTEIFSIGATLYEAITGRPPFGRIERFQVPASFRTRRPGHWNPNVPPWLDSLILNCLNVRQERRFQCYSELLYALEHPESAPAYVDTDLPLVERNPLLFYKVAFWMLLLLSVVLIFKLLACPR